MWKQELKQKVWRYNSLGLLALLAFVLGVYVFSRWFSMPDCLFLSMLGLYCPGCGGTRAVFAFFSGQFFRSLCYFPPLWVAGVIVLRMDILAVLSLATGNPHHASRIRAKSLLWVAVSVLAWFVLRNLLLLCGFDIVLFADGLA